MKERQRYIAYAVHSTKQFNRLEVRRAIETELLRFLGENGYSQAGIQLLTDGVIRVDHKSIPETITGLSMINHINGVPAAIRTVTTSGILKKAKIAFKRRDN